MLPRSWYPRIKSFPFLPRFYRVACRGNGYRKRALEALDLLPLDSISLSFILFLGSIEIGIDFNRAALSSRKRIRVGVETRTPRLYSSWFMPTRGHKVGDGGRAGRVRDTRRLSAGTLGAVVAQSTPRPAGGFEALVSFLFSFLPSSPKSVYNFFNRFIYARTVDC